LELVHSDVCGPLETPSLGGSRYFVTFIDDFSKWTFVYTMKKKSDTFTCFKKFHKLAERHAGSKIRKINVINRSNLPPEQLKTLRTDNGGEYLSNEFKNYLEGNGIKHELTIAYTPQQNGVAERMNRTILDLIRSMLHASHVPKEFWAEALTTAVYIRNRVPSHALPSSETPYHRWMGKSPNLSHLRVFGCKCWYVIRKELSDSVHVQGGEIVKELTDDTNPSNPTAEVDVEESDEDEFQDTNTESSPVLRRSSRVRKPTREWWKAAGHYVQALSAQAIPTSYRVAVSPEYIEFWKPGIDREHECITRNKTWSFVERKPNMHVLPCKYVFKIKDGTPKVRLVAMGCRQVYGVDYNDIRFGQSSRP